MTFGSLFAGIGGMDLGLERAGMTCKWQVEIDPFCRKVLTKHWPEVPKYGDIRTITGSGLERVDLIAGGFPCQDVSRAGYGAGIHGERSGLYREMLRLVCMVRPYVVLMENVAALLDDGLGIVLADLADIGFDAEWSVVSACSMGATHMRQRVFIVAHSNSVDGWTRVWNPDARKNWQIQKIDGFAGARACAQARVENPSELYGGANGVSFGLERNRGIGNAVYPQVAEWIGRRIIEVSHEPADVG